MLPNGIGRYSHSAAVRAVVGHVGAIVSNCPESQQTVVCLLLTGIHSHLRVREANLASEGARNVEETSLHADGDHIPRRSGFGHEQRNRIV